MGDRSWLMGTRQLLPACQLHELSAISDTMVGTLILIFHFFSLVSLFSHTANNITFINGLSLIYYFRPFQIFDMEFLTMIRNNLIYAQLFSLSKLAQLLFGG